MADQERFLQTYHDHYRDVYVFCRRRVRADHVDDVVAETFMTVWKKIDQMPAPDAALPWLYGIAHRVLMHEWRGSSRRRRLEKKLGSIGVEHPAADLPDIHIVANEESQRVLDVASRLKQSDQEILRLSLWEELAHSDIATVLGIREDAVRQRLSRALKRLTNEYNKAEKKNTSALLGKEVSSDH